MNLRELTGRLHLSDGFLKTAWTDVKAGYKFTPEKCFKEWIEKLRSDNDLFAKLIEKKSALTRNFVIDNKDVFLKALWKAAKNAKFSDQVFKDFQDLGLKSPRERREEYRTEKLGEAYGENEMHQWDNTPDANGKPREMSWHDQKLKI